jgi:very-short-patch-repair endonuclease
MNMHLPIDPELLASARKLRIKQTDAENLLWYFVREIGD